MEDNARRDPSACGATDENQARRLFSYGSHQIHLVTWRRETFFEPDLALADACSPPPVATRWATDSELNTCKLDASDLSEVVTVNVNFPPNASVVVNVTGATVNWTSGVVCLNGQCNDGYQSDFVLWNFYQATSLWISGMALEGSILAPLATLDGSGGHIAGQVIVQNLTGGLEYHPYLFAGCI